MRLVFPLLVAALSGLTFAGVWYAAGPATMPPASVLPEPAATIAAPVRYDGCDDVRAAGAAPLLADQPGYRSDMDGDHDGIACEPHRDEPFSVTAPRR